MQVFVIIINVLITFKIFSELKKKCPRVNPTRPNLMLLFLFICFMQMLYEAEDFATSSRKIEDIYNEALAIYHTSYNYAQSLKDVKKCGFAWKVASEALCSFHERRFLSN